MLTILIRMKRVYVQISRIMIGGPAFRHYTTDLYNEKEIVCMCVGVGGAEDAAGTLVSSNDCKGSPTDS